MNIKTDGDYIDPSAPMCACGHTRSSHTSDGCFGCAGPACDSVDGPCACGAPTPCWPGATTCAFMDTGYPWCTHCRTHHRHPEDRANAW